MNILLYILAAILIYMITVSLKNRNALIGFGEIAYSVQDNAVSEMNSAMPLLYDYRIEQKSICIQLRSISGADCKIYSSKGHLVASFISTENHINVDLDTLKKGVYKVIITDKNHQTETYGMKLENNSCVSIKKLNVNLQK